MIPHEATAMYLDQSEKEEFLTLINRLKMLDAQLVGRLHLFSLHRVREHLGARWKSLSEGVHGTFRSILKGAAQNTFVFYPYDEDSYLVFSFLGSTKQAQQRVASISHEILAKLFGSEASPDLMETYVWALGDKGHPAFQRIEPGLHTSHIRSSGVFNFIYRPLLRVRDTSISAQHCLPIREMGAVGFCAGYDVVANIENPLEFAELDNLTLEHVAADLAKSDGQDDRSQIIIPVHFETLKHATQGQAYLRKCRLLFPSQSADLAFEVFGLPERLTEYNFGALVWQLRSAAEHVIARVSLDDPDFIDLRIAGVEGVSVDMYNDFRNEHQLLERLNQFSAHAHAEGLKASASGIRTLSLHTLAVSSGADFVGGYPVSNATRTIGGRKTFDLSALYNAAAHAA